ncbi:MAG: PKD domain-containing protein [Paludibacter sp.]|nr:PKD domain-containing protein [Paludibacter sp.]
MKTKYIYKLLFATLLSVTFLSSCADDILPKIEDLPSPAVAFNYYVSDNTYRLDYYVGANIKFESKSAAKGLCTWDFGDGKTATGDIVTYKYAVAGTYNVKLTVEGAGFLIEKILISDIKPILTLKPIPGGLCEVLSTLVEFNVELPNPEVLGEEYKWIFPAGTLDENGVARESFTGKNPDKLKFSHVGSQKVLLQVKLGGRWLEDGVLNVPVAYNQTVPTLYYAVKLGNIMALKLVAVPPAGMIINPFDLGVKSGQKPLNILFNDTSLYVLDAGRQFTYVNDADGNLGDGRIFVVSKSGSKVETMLTNTGAAFSDPFYGYVEGTRLFFADRNTGICTINLTERNKSLVRGDFPYYVQNATLGYYGQGLSFGAMNAGFGKINNVWYWCKTFNGNGIFRFVDADILKTPITGNGILPTSGVVLEGMSPKSFVWDAKNQVFYFTVYDTGYEGLYRCTLAQLEAIKTRDHLNPYKLKLANGKTVTPITEAGKGEGSSGEFIGICQLALDEADGSVYFGLRSADATVKSGLMRYSPAKGFIEHVIEGVEVYGVAVNKTKSKLF